MDRNSDTDVGSRIKARRQQLDIPASVIALECDLSVEEYEAREQGKKRFSAVELLQVARALETKISWFFEG